MNRMLKQWHRRSFLLLSALLLMVAAVGAGGWSEAASASTKGHHAASRRHGGHHHAASKRHADSLASLKTYVKKMEQRPKHLTVPSLPKAPPKGGTIDFVACGAPTCQEMGNYVHEATQALGWNYDEIQAGLSPQTVSTAYDQAVRNDPTGVIGSGSFTPKIMAHQLQQLRAEGSTPVLISVPSAGKASGAIMTKANEKVFGKELGSWLVTNAKGKKIHLLVVTTPLDPIFNTLHAAVRSVVNKHCSGCTVQTFDYADTKQGTIPTLVVPYVKAHPTVNYMLFDYADSVAGVPAALQKAGLAGQVKIVTTDTGPAESEYLLHGQEAASAAIAWPEFLWGAVNVIVRAKMKLALGPALHAKFPNMLLTGKDLPPVATKTMFPLVAKFKTAYEKAWHVKS